MAMTFGCVARWFDASGRVAIFNSWKGNISTNNVENSPRKSLGLCLGHSKKHLKHKQKLVYGCDLQHSSEVK